MKFKTKTVRRLNLDITPLIDVIFLLLIFFMVSTTFITSPGIHVNLPEADTRSKPEKPEYLELVITEKSEFFVAGKAFRKEKLKSALATARKKTGLDKLVIKADGAVQHKEVVFAMDMAKQTGLHKLSIATKVKHKEE